MERISTKTAAKILGMANISIQGGLRMGTLPIGSAWKNPDSKYWTYHISPKLLSDYTGLSVEEIKKEEGEESE